jgi:hypothetical protein
VSGNSSSIGKPSWFVLAFGAGAAWIAWQWKDGGRHAAAGKSAPVRTVIVHTVTTHVTHSGMPGWGMVVIAVVALGVLCALTLGRSS